MFKLLFLAFALGFDSSEPFHEKDGNWIDMTCFYNWFSHQPDVLTYNKTGTIDQCLAETNYNYVVTESLTHDRLNCHYYNDTIPTRIVRKWPKFIRRNCDTRLYAKIQFCASYTGENNAVNTSSYGNFFLQPGPALFRWNDTDYQFLGFNFSVNSTIDIDFLNITNLTLPFELMWLQQHRFEQGIYENQMQKVISKVTVVKGAELYENWGFDFDGVFKNTPDGVGTLCMDAEAMSPLNCTTWSIFNNNTGEFFEEDILNVTEGMCPEDPYPTTTEEPEPTPGPIAPTVQPTMKPEPHNNDSKGKFGGVGIVVVALVVGGLFAGLIYFLYRNFCLQPQSNQNYVNVNTQPGMA